MARWRGGGGGRPAATKGMDGAMEVVTELINSGHEATSPPYPSSRGRHLPRQQKEQRCWLPFSFPFLLIDMARGRRPPPPVVAKGARSGSGWLGSTTVTAARPGQRRLLQQGLRPSLGEVDLLSARSGEVDPPSLGSGVPDPLSSSSGRAYPPSLGSRCR